MLNMCAGEGASREGGGGRAGQVRTHPRQRQGKQGGGTKGNVFTFLFMLLFTVGDKL